MEGALIPFRYEDSEYNSREKIVVLLDFFKVAVDFELLKLFTLISCLCSRKRTFQKGRYLVADSCHVSDAPAFVQK
jgi:hypothetical protein